MWPHLVEWQMMHLLFVDHHRLGIIQNTCKCVSTIYKGRKNILLVPEDHFLSLITNLTLLIITTNQGNKTTLCLSNGHIKSWPYKLCTRKHMFYYCHSSCIILLPTAHCRYVGKNTTFNTKIRHFYFLAMLKLWNTFKSQWHINYSNPIQTTGLYEY